MTATKTAGFYKTEVESYYVTPLGKVWAWGSGDFDGVREITSLPVEARTLGGLITVEEIADILGQIEAEGGELLLRVASGDDDERKAWKYACDHQGFDGDYAEWQVQDDAARKSYEDGAAGVGTA